MSARLIPLSASFGPVIPLQRPVLLVGRHPDCDIQIDLPKISRRHCCLALANDRVLIRDLGSRNGVRVNGLVVDEARLNTGDEVAIGHLIYRVEDHAAPSAPPPSPGGLAAKNPPPSLPNLPVDPQDPDGDLIPMLDL